MRPSQRLHDLLRCHGILREAVEGAVDLDLLLLLVDPFDLRHSANPADGRLDPLGIIFQFAVVVPVAMDRDKNRDRIAEVVIDHRAHHAVWQLGRLEFRHIETQLGPELLGVLDVVFHLDIDEHRSVHARRVGFSAPYTFDFEEPLLDFLRDLIFNFRGGCSWVECGDNAHAHMDFRVFPARHAEQSVPAACDQHDDHRNGDLGIAQRGAYEIHWAPPAISTSMPSRSFCCPPTTTCSSPRKPERISTSVPIGGPTSILCAYTRLRSGK